MGGSRGGRAVLAELPLPKFDLNPCDYPPGGAPPAPPGVNINSNIQIAQGVGIENTFLAGPVAGPLESNMWMAWEVRTGGPFDYKQQGLQYVPFGNFNFGAVCGAIGDSLTTCQMGAGAQHVFRFGMLELASPFTGHNPQYGGQGVPFITAPYGDQPNDSVMIGQGYAYFQWQQACQ